MKKIPPESRETMSKDPYFQSCSLYGQAFGECDGRITWDHPLRYAGSQVVEPWATNPLCAKHHNVDQWQDAKTYKEEISLWVVLSNATKQQIISVSKAVDYGRMLLNLSIKYGAYKRIYPSTLNEKAESLLKAIESHKLKAFRPRQFWYPVSEAQKAVIQKAINHFRDIEGVYYTPFQMIERMIVEFGSSLDEMSEENRI